jgi:hypothetical protein
MLKVYKYEVPLADDFAIEMPMGAQILSFQVQNGGPVLWALVDPDARHMKRHFRLAGTGHKIDQAPADLRFIGTVQLQGGALVFHLFEALR